MNTAECKMYELDCLSTRRLMFACITSELDIIHTTQEVYRCTLLSSSFLLFIGNARVPFLV